MYQFPPALLNKIPTSAGSTAAANIFDQSSRATDAGWYDFPSGNREIITSEEIFITNDSIFVSDKSAFGLIKMFGACGTNLPAAIWLSFPEDFDPALVISPWCRHHPSVSELTVAQRLLSRLRDLSGLTLELIAPLVRVSRRSLQKWLAGEAISLRKEERLRALVETVENIASVEPKSTRDRLLERISGSPRIYDLLSEGRFVEAIERSKGRRPIPIHHSHARHVAVPLDVQVASSDGPAVRLGGELNRRVSRRLKS